MLDSLHHVFGSYLASEWSAVCFAIISDAVESGVGVEVQLARMSNIIRACVGEDAWHSANIPSTQLYWTMVCELIYWDSYGIYVLLVKLPTAVPLWDVIYHQLLPLRPASALRSAICLRLLIPLKLLPVDDDACVTTGFESPTSPAHTSLMNTFHMVFAYHGLLEMAKSVSYAIRSSAFRREIVV